VFGSGTLSCSSFSVFNDKRSSVALCHKIDQRTALSCYRFCMMGAPSCKSRTAGLGCSLAAFRALGMTSGQHKNMRTGLANFVQYSYKVFLISVSDVPWHILRSPVANLRHALQRTRGACRLSRIPETTWFGDVTELQFAFSAWQKKWWPAGVTQGAVALCTPSWECTHVTQPCGAKCSFDKARVCSRHELRWCSWTAPSEWKCSFCQMLKVSDVMC
jgi:hypothetical protein